MLQIAQLKIGLTGNLAAYATVQAIRPHTPRLRDHLAPRNQVAVSLPNVYAALDAARLGAAMRQFIRHPVSIPIEVRAGEHAGGELHHAGNLGLGGLEFNSDSEIELGSLVEVRIPIIEPAFATCGRVAWCHRMGNTFQLGVQFLDVDEAYRTRMVEQVCHIEEYRRSVQRIEGRELSAEEAAFEWIHRFAAQFPEAGYGPS